jgi:hypothetical protein
MSSGHSVLILGMFVVLGGTALASPKPAPVCKVTFSVAYLDRLNNLNNGIPQDSLKGIQKKLD